MKTEKELLEIRKQTMEDLTDFYRRLPEMTAIDVVSEFQQKVRNLIDYIIELEKGYKHA